MSKTTKDLNDAEFRSIHRLHAKGVLDEDIADRIGCSVETVREVYNNPLKAFIKVAPPIDQVRDEAARCADETAKFERGERGPVRMTTSFSLLSEFSGEAAGVAAEVAMVVMEACKEAGQPVTSAFCWSTAATMLRNGWQRGHKLKGMVVKEQKA